MRCPDKGKRFFKEWRKVWKEIERVISDYNFLKFYIINAQNVREPSAQHNTLSIHPVDESRKRMPGHPSSYWLYSFVKSFHCKRFWPSSRLGIPARWNLPCRKTSLLPAVIGIVNAFLASSRNVIWNSKTMPRSGLIINVIIFFCLALINMNICVWLERSHSFIRGGGQK